VKVTDQGVAVPDVIADVKLAIKEASVSATDENRDLRVSSVRLTLHALATRSIGGGLDFRIPFIGMAVKVGTKVTRSDTHEIEINLAPPGEPTGQEVREAILDTALVDAIETIRAAVASAAGGDDPFVLNDATITLSFAVTAEGEISIGVDGGLSNELTHTLTLGLKPAPSHS
jgi:Trypsin-co-occurring domain 2